MDVNDNSTCATSVAPTSLIFGESDGREVAIDNSKGSHPYRARLGGLGLLGYASTSKFGVVGGTW